METDSGLGKLMLSKLDGTNYAAWKFKVKMLLIHKDLWKVVSGEEENPGKSAKSLALIGLAVSDSQIVYVQDCATGKEAWEKLSSLYENKGVANKMHLMDELMNSKMENDTLAHKHIEKLRSIVGKLGTIGAAVSDDHYKMALLRSLPESYEGLVVTLENLMDDLSIEDIHARIIREEGRKGKMDGSTGKVDGEKLLHSKDVRCHFCKKKGHIKSQCWKLNGKPKHLQGQRSGKHNQGKPRIENSHAFQAIEDTSSTTTWFIDSGASYHATGNETLFSKGSVHRTHTRKIELADGSMVEANTVGTIAGYFTTEHGEYPVRLLNVLLVPKMKVNLISVSAIQEKGYYVTFRSNVCEIARESDDETALMASKSGRCYKVILSTSDRAYASHQVGDASKLMWHARMGHVSPNVADELMKDGRMISSDAHTGKDSLENCSACLKGKMARRSFNEAASRSAKSKLELVHSDLCGPMSSKSLGGARYFMILVDDFTRFTYVAFIKKKSDTLQEFQYFVALVLKQGYGAVQRLRTDKGTEYMNNAFKSYLKSNGIVHETSAPYTPEQNGIAERANRTLIEKARCMMHHAKLSTSYWAEAISTACYLKNITPTRSINGKVPRAEFMDEQISYRHIRVFGCLSYVHTPKESRKKV